MKIIKYWLYQPSLYYGRIIASPLFLNKKEKECKSLKSPQAIYITYTHSILKRKPTGKE